MNKKKEIRSHKKTLKSLLKSVGRITSICSKQEWKEMPFGKVVVEIELWNVDVVLSDKGFFINKGRKCPPRPRPEPKPRRKDEA